MRTLGSRTLRESQQLAVVNLVKASLHKAFPQRRRDAERPAPSVGGSRRPPPLWRLAFGGYVGYRAMSRQTHLLLKDLLLKCRSHFKSKSFKKGSCAGWISFPLRITKTWCCRVFATMLLRRWSAYMTQAQLPHKRLH